VKSVGEHRRLPENIERVLAGFAPDAHAMGMFLATVGALSTSYPDAKHVLDAESRHLQIRRLIAKAPTVAAYIFRHGSGQPYVAPDDSLGQVCEVLRTREVRRVLVIDSAGRLLGIIGWADVAPALSDRLMGRLVSDVVVTT
jgi:citrate synthase